MIRALYLIYQIFIALPIMIVATIITALVTMIGSVFNDRFWGYWPGMIWGRLFYLVFLIPVHIHGKENIRKGQSYVIAPTIRATGTLSWYTDISALSSNG